MRPAVDDVVHRLLSVARTVCAWSCFSQVADLGASVDKLNKVGSLHKACTGGTLQHFTNSDNGMCLSSCTCVVVAQVARCNIQYL